jgi:hypothetical protein
LGWHSTNSIAEAVAEAEPPAAVGNGDGCVASGLASSPEGMKHVGNQWRSPRRKTKNRALDETVRIKTCAKKVNGRACKKYVNKNNNNNYIAHSNVLKVMYRLV